MSVDTDDGRLRPDVIVNLPGGRKLIIDAKCSLNAYLDASEHVDDDTRKSHLKAHAASIRNHAQQLGSKNYWAQFGDAADYVVMYIPGEHFLTAALEQDDGLWEWAFERKVLLATPTCGTGGRDCGARQGAPLAARDHGRACRPAWQESGVGERRL